MKKFQALLFIIVMFPVHNIEPNQYWNKTKAKAQDAWQWVKKNPYKAGMIATGSALAGAGIASGVQAGSRYKNLVNAMQKLDIALSESLMENVDADATLSTLQSAPVDFSTNAKTGWNFLLANQSSLQEAGQLAKTIANYLSSSNIDELMIARIDAVLSEIRSFYK